MSFLSRLYQSAMSHEHIEKVEKHASQVDAAKGFGGKYGVESDRVDKSAVSWAHKEEAQKHASQHGNSELSRGPCSRFFGAFVLVAALLSYEINL